MLPIGGGIDRIKREMEIFIRENKKTESSVIDIAQSFESLIIKRGGKHFNCVTKEIDGAAIIDFDHLIHRFGFRAQERTFQDVLRIASIVKQKGTLFIQTNNPKSVLIKSLKAQDYNLFYDYELSLRRSAGYPPFKKLIAIEVNIKGAMNEDKIRMGTGDLKEGIELLGPLELAKNIKGCDRRLRYIVRSSNKKAMDAFVRDTQKKASGHKGRGNGHRS
jgi:Primosomal protein N' (replication factor Y) - superfamily II helicase